MQITAFQVYLVGIFGGLRVALALLSLSLLAVGFFGSAYILIEIEDELHMSMLLRLWRWLAPALASVLLALVLVPSYRTAAAMLVLPRLANRDFVQQDVPEALRLMTRVWIEKLAEDKDEQ